jgi:tetratricopeptide (TPR) repeat protein
MLILLAGCFFLPISAQQLPESTLTASEFIEKKVSQPQLNIPIAINSCNTVVRDSDGFVNVRSTPFIQSDNILQTLPNGTVLIVIDTQNGWLRIRQPIIGWVASSRTTQKCSSLAYKQQSEILIGQGLDKLRRVYQSEIRRGQELDDADILGEYKNLNNEQEEQEKKVYLFGAIEDFSQAIRLNSNSSESYYYRGITHLETLNSLDRTTSEAIHQAISDFSEAIRLKPSFTGAYYDRAIAQAFLISRISCSGALRSRQDLKQYRRKAIEDLSQVIQLNPNLAGAHFARGSLLQETSGQASTEDFSQMIRLNPNLFDNNFGRGLVRMAWIEYENFEDAVNSASQLSKSSLRGGDELYQKGFAQIAAAYSQQAINTFTKLLSLEPTSAEAYYGRGLAYYRLGYFEQSLQDLTQAIQLNSDFADTYIIRGLIYYQLGNKQRAIEDSTQAINLEPDNSNASFVLALAVKGAEDKYPGAGCGGLPILGDGRCGCGGSSLEGNPLSYYHRGVSLEKRGDKQGAILNFQRAALLFKSKGDSIRYQEMRSSIERLKRSY